MAFESDTDWEAWLAEHHATVDGVWIKMAKKSTGLPTVTHAQAVEVALCYGWIDGQRNRFDDQWFLQRFTPRRSRSNWSKINRDKAEQLIREGRMQPAGLVEVERARADGRWDAAYDSPRTATVPDDLAAALADEPAARQAFDELDGTNRYAVLWRVHTAATPQTRARRIASLVQVLAEGRRPHGGPRRTDLRRG